MKGRGFSNGFGSSDNDKEELIGTVQEKKASPERGQKRLIVKEKYGRRKAVAIDVPVQNSTKVDRKETYAFKVEDKEKAREQSYGYEHKSLTGGFRTYRSDDMPEKFSGSRLGTDMTRFGGGGRSGKSRFT